jgi:hypothetical protein
MVIIPQGYVNLIQEILLLTKSDLRIRSKKKGEYFQMRQDALMFIHTDWFETLCLSVYLDPDAVRERFLRPEGNK